MREDGGGGGMGENEDRHGQGITARGDDARGNRSFICGHRARKNKEARGEGGAREDKERARACGHGHACGHSSRTLHLACDAASENYVKAYIMHCMSCNALNAVRYSACVKYVTHNT